MLTVIVEIIFGFLIVNEVMYMMLILFVKINSEL